MSEAGIPEAQTSPEPAPRDLRSELRETFDPNFSTLGHGTRLEVAPKILKEGLRTKFNELDTTTRGLFDGSKSYEEQVDGVIDTITQWPHHNLDAVVVIMIPNAPKDQVGGKVYFNSVFEELPVPEDDPVRGYKDQYIIPTSYIKGFVDVKGRKFVVNPAFAPTVPEIKRNPPSKVAEAASRLGEKIKAPGVTRTTPTKGNEDIW